MAPTNDVHIVRVYDHDGDVPINAYRVLVDRLWPRGVKKESLAYDDWCKDIAPTTDLRKWYGHDPDRFDEFRNRYRVELGSDPAKSALCAIRVELEHRSVVILTAVKQVEISAAAVISDALTNP